MEKQTYKYSFIGRYPEFSVAVLVDDGNGKLVNEKVLFRNAVYQTNDSRIGEGLLNHKFNGIDWFENKKKREVVNEFKKADEQNIHDYLSSLPLSQLRNIANEKKISKYPDLMKIKKVDLISRMIEKRHLLGEFDIGGD